MSSVHYFFLFSLLLFTSKSLKVTWDLHLITGRNLLNHFARSMLTQKHSPWSVSSQQALSLNCVVWPGLNWLWCKILVNKHINVFVKWALNPRTSSFSWRAAYKMARCIDPKNIARSPIIATVTSMLRADITSLALEPCSQLEKPLWSWPGGVSCGFETAVRLGVASFIWHSQKGLEYVCGHGCVCVSVAWKKATSECLFII